MSVCQGDEEIQLGGEDWLSVTYFGAMSEPCCMSDPMVYQSELIIVNWFTRTDGSRLHGCGLSHS